MTPFDALPASSVSWFLGMIGTLIIGVRSLLTYRRSRVELSKYMAWFGLTVGVALGFFSIPTFFTLDFATLNTYYKVGQFFFFSSMIAQAAIVWCLLFRARLSVYYLTIPVGLIGFSSWLYALPRSHLFSEHGFMAYYDPRLTTVGIACLLIGLFLPVGLYFLKMAPGQSGLKAKFTAATFGVAYMGVGIITGGFELLTGQIMTRASAFGSDGFYVFLIVAALWPRKNVFSSPPSPVVNDNGGAATDADAGRIPPPPAGSSSLTS